MQPKQPHILTLDEVQPGDVILCYETVLSEKVRDTTGSGYSHAAICLEKGVIEDASRSGIKKLPLKELIGTYAHAVVVRQPDCWDAQRMAHLRQLVEQAIQNKTKFNVDGLRYFESRRQQHEQEMTSRVTDYFDGRALAPTGVSDRYFFSEFIAALYIQVGFVSPSAAVVYDPMVTSPADLKDGTYGFFAGYLVPYEDYKIPVSDDFYHDTAYHEIFNQPQSPAESACSMELARRRR